MTAPDVRLVALLVIATGILSPAATEAVHGDDEGWWFPTQGRWIEEQIITPESESYNSGLGMTFGSRVAVHGDTLVVGVLFDSYNDDLSNHCRNLGNDDGCDWVYVFNRGSNGHWRQTARLVPDDARPGDTFGWVVDVDEDSGVIVVGNPGRDARADQAYIFERMEDGAWIQTANIKKEYAELPYHGHTAFGISVAVSGLTVAVNDMVNAGTFVYEKRNGEWAQSAELRGGSGPENVDLAGDTLVTAHGERRDFCEGTTTWDSRPIHVYNRIDGEWNLTAKFEPEQAQNKTQSLVTRLGMNDAGDAIVLGAAVDRRMYGVHTEICLHEDAGPLGEVNVYTIHGAAGAVGSAYIYELVEDEWIQTADIPNPVPNPPGVGGSLFSASVSIGDGLAAISAYGDMYNGPGDRSGTVYLYEKVNGEWILSSRLRNHDSEPFDWFGDSVAITESTVVVGAPRNTPTGAVHVFEPLDIGWDVPKG